MNKNNKKKNECANLNELVDWLDARGFDTFEAIEFINDSLLKELRKKVISEVEKCYSETEEQAYDSK